MHNDLLFNLWKNGQVIAACPTIEAHNVARRLLTTQFTTKENSTAGIGVLKRRLDLRR